MILLSMPYYNSPETVVEAVNSLLNQSYKQFILLVINDGSEQAPKQLLKIKDSRLKFFNMVSNRGRYFADAVSLAANPYPYFLPTDADDISDYNRLKYLMLTAKRTDADFVYHYQKFITKQGRIIRETYPLMQKPMSRQMQHLAHWSGLYKTEALREIGGPHPDFRVAYDTLVVNLIRLRYKVACEPKFLYTRYYRNNSLTRAHDTGFGSPQRRQAAYQLLLLYRQCFNNIAATGDIIRKSISNKTYRAVLKEADRLKREMSW